MNGLKPITLEGKHIRLIPLLEEHKVPLLEAASDGKLWELWFTSVPDEHSIDAYISRALDEQKKGAALPFVVVHKATGNIIGCTRYCNIVPGNRRLEIGYTWYASSHQRTAVNTEAKLLLLGFAFEQANAMAVELRTHWHNHRSRAAIARLGAKQDGVLRMHQVDKDGDYRDTVVFSILATEWPMVKKSLQYRLKAE